MLFLGVFDQPHFVFWIRFIAEGAEELLLRSFSKSITMGEPSFHVTQAR